MLNSLDPPPNENNLSFTGIHTLSYTLLDFSVLANIIPFNDDIFNLQLCIEPGSPCEFLTCGEDGVIFHADLREEKAHK